MPTARQPKPPDRLNSCFNLYSSFRQDRRINSARHAVCNTILWFQIITSFC